MLFHPAVIAILLSSGLAVLMLLVASPFALQVIRRWDTGSGSELQLRLERRTYLFSTLTAFVFDPEIVAQSDQFLAHLVNGCGTATAKNLALFAAL